ncbi:MAG: carboxypeptidase regulatory-like domain-containing protein [bacterium]|nr:carboxypeptidase regulatory-like domain-containing protein [bacterium]
MGRAAGVGSASPRVVALRAGANELRLELEPYADLVGRIEDSGGPVADARLGMQRVGKNRYWKFLTDRRGRFEFEPLPPGSYRLYVSGHEVRRIELEPGERRDEVFRLGERTMDMMLVEDGEPARHIDSASLLCLDPASEDYGRHFTADLIAPGRLRVRRPSGAALLAFTRHGPSTNRTEVVGVPAGGGTIELDQNRVVMDGPADLAGGPPVRGELVEVHGVRLADVWKWGGPIELAFVRDDAGRQVFRGMPAGSRLLLRGFDATGRELERTVVVGTGESAVRLE